MERLGVCRLTLSPCLVPSVAFRAAAAALTLAVLVGCSAAGAPATPDASAETPAEELAAGEPDAGKGEWLVDEDGIRYREVRMPKLEGYYRVTPDGTEVFLPPGLRYKLVRIEEDAFVVKQYDPEQLQERRREAMAAAQTAAQAAADLEADQLPLTVETETADRAELTRFGRSLPRRGQWRQGFAVADLNGDGHLDIVHAPPRKGGTVPLVFLGDSRGGWRLWQELRYEGPDLDYGDVAAADFDGDGNLDLAFAVHLRGLLVALGDGQGGFTRWQTDDLEYRLPGEGGPPAYTSRTVEALDWDGDGRTDLLTLSEGPRMGRDQSQPQMHEGSWGVGLYLNRGGGEWELQRGEVLGTPPFGDDLAVGDFNADGLPDFAIGLSVAGSKAILHIHESGGGFEQRNLEALPTGLVTAVEAADFDGDGRDDLAVGVVGTTPGMSATVVALFLARENGEWERRILAAEEEQVRGISALGAGDLDGDGFTDLVALTGTGARWVFLGAGGGALRREESPELAPSDPGCRGYEVHLADLDGDGRDEAILAFAGEEGTEKLFGAIGAERQCPSGGSLEVWTLGPDGP